MKNETTDPNPIAIAIARSIPRPWILGLVFLTLQLCGVINWEWWIVALPFYAIPALVVGVYFVTITVSLVVAIVCFPFWVFNAFRARRKINKFVKDMEDRAKQKEPDAAVKDEVDRTRRLRAEITKT